MLKIPANARPYLVLLAGITLGSFASTIVRFAQQAGMTSVALTTLRLTLGSVLLAPLVLRNQPQVYTTLTRLEVGLCVLSGMMLGFHFVVFISAIEYTSIMVMQVLANITPVFTALLGWLTLGEVIKRPVIFGIPLVLAGAAIIGASGEAGNPSTRADPLLGNSLAALSAVFLAVYFTIGRRIRRKLGGMQYSWIVFVSAAVTMLLVTALTDNTLFGYSRDAYFWMILLTLVAQVGTHTAFNYVLGHINATLISITMMLIPVGATIVAAVFLNEVPGPIAIVGAAIIMAGVAMANLAGD